MLGARLYCTSEHRPQQQRARVWLCSVSGSRIVIKLELVGGVSVNRLVVGGQTREIDIRSLLLFFFFLSACCNLQQLQLLSVRPHSAAAAAAAAAAALEAGQSVQRSCSLQIFKNVCLIFGHCETAFGTFRLLYLCDWTGQDRRESHWSGPGVCGRARTQS